MNKGMFFLLATLLSSAAHAGQWVISAGGTYARSSSTVSANNLSGDEEVSVSFEKDLNVTDASFFPELSIAYEFNERHMLGFSYVSLHRDGTNTRISQPFEIDWIDDNVYEVQVGADITTTFNYDVYRLTYGYKVLHRDAFDLSLNAGLHIIPIELGFSGTLAACVDGQCDSSQARAVSSSVTAPLPNFGLTGVWRFYPRWNLTANAQYFYLKVDQFTGSLLDVNASVNYNLTDAWSVGMGYGLYDLYANRKQSSSELEVDVRYQGAKAAVAYRF
jgi:outer membrane protein W